MKNNLLRFLPFVALLLIASACNKAEDTQALSSVSSAPISKISLDHLNQKALFLYGAVNANEEIETGWVITKEGAIRRFQLDGAALSLDDKECSKQGMIQLGAALGETIGSVPMEDLIENFEKVKATINFVPVETANPDAQSSVAFLAYDAVTPGNSLNCGLGEDCNKSNYNQVLLSLEGVRQVTNPGESAQAILTWLKSLEKELN